MKKRIIIILSILLILSVVLGLYHTYAIDSTIDDVSSSTYAITLSEDTNVVTVPSKSSKTIIYKLCNTNKAVVKYGVGYTSNNIKVKVWYDTIDSETGLINYGEYKFIKLKLINDSSEESTVKLSTILGYEHGGDLIVPENTTLVTEKIKEINYINGGSANGPEDNYLNTTLPCNSIERVKFVKDNIAFEGALGSFDVSQNQDKSIMLWYTDIDNNNLYEVYIGSESGVVYQSSNWKMFSHLSNMKEIDLTYFNTSKATTFIYMFYGCSSLKELDLSNFDTSNVTIMTHMFTNCSSLTKLDLGSFDTSKVTIMTHMFYNCSSLTHLDLSNFDTSKVTKMNSMFAGCSSLTELDLSNFDTSNVINMGSMFFECSSLTKLDLSNFDTSNVTDMLSMFWNCNSLTELDLSSFNLDNVTSTNQMFRFCSKLNKIDFRSASFSNITDYLAMFGNVPNDSVIYVKDTTQKSWIESNFTNLTNVVVP